MSSILFIEAEQLTLNQDSNAEGWSTLRFGTVQPEFAPELANLRTWIVDEGRTARKCDALGGTDTNRSAKVSNS